MLSPGENINLPDPRAPDVSIKVLESWGVRGVIMLPGIDDIEKAGVIGLMGDRVLISRGVEGVVGEPVP